MRFFAGETGRALALSMDNIIHALSLATAENIKHLSLALRAREKI